MGREVRSRLVGLAVLTDRRHELLQGGGLDRHPRRLGALPFVGAQLAADGRRDDAAEPPRREQLTTSREREDIGLEPARQEGGAPGVLDIGLQDDPPTVEDEHLLDQLGRLVDEMGGHDERARRSGAVSRPLVARGIHGQQFVVEDAARGRVQSEVGLVQEGVCRSAGEREDDRQGGALAAGELARSGAARDPEASHQAGRDLVVPLGVEGGHDREDVGDREGVVVGLVLVHEAQPGEGRSVLQRVVSVDADLTTVAEGVPGDAREQRRLARAVGAEQPVDPAGLQGGRDVDEHLRRAVALGQTAQGDPGTCRGDSGGDAGGGACGRGAGRGAGGGGAHQRSLVTRATISSIDNPSRRPSSTKGRTNCSEKASRR